MKAFFLCTTIAVFFSFQSSFSQSIPDLWARRGGGTSSDAGSSVAVDADGNVIVAGAYRQTAAFGNITLPQLDDDDQPNIFVAKYDPSGNVLWAKAAGGIFWDEAKGVAIDANGDIIITGSYGYFADFGNGITLDPPDSDNDELFIAKYNKDGVTLWAKSYGGPGSHWGFGIAVDAANRIFVTGFFDDRFDFPDIAPLLTSGSGDIYVASFNADGTFRWAQKAGGAEDDRGHGVATDQDNNVFVTGYFTGAANFSPNIQRQSFGDKDAFVAKYDNSGTPLWARSGGGTNNDRGNAVATDGAGNVVFTGFFTEYCEFDGGFDLFGEPNVASVLLAKFDPDGEVLDAAPRSSTLVGQGRGVAIYRLDRIFLTGWFTGDASIDTDDDDDIIMTSAGAEDVFFARFFSDEFDNLKVTFATRAGGLDSDQGLAIAVNQQRHVAFTGQFKGTAIFDPNACAAPDSAKIQSTNNTFDVFVARHTPTAQQVPDPPSNLVLESLGGPRVTMRLTWQDNSDNEDGFIIIRRDQEYDRVPANVTTYIDSAVVERESYLYRVQAFNQCGVSPSSNEAGNQTGINSPSHFTATPETSTRLHLTWQDNSAVEDGFIIERSTTDEPDFYLPIDTLGADVEESYDTAVTPRLKYYYRIYSCEDCDPSSGDNSDPTKTSAVAAVLYPTAQVTWDVGTMHRMVWSPPSPSGVMKVEYSTDDGRNWTSVTEALNDQGCFDWLVPNTPTESCRMRVYDNANPSVYLESALFTAGKPKAPYLLASNVVGHSGQLTSDIIIAQNMAPIQSFSFKLKFDPDHLEFIGGRNVGLTADWPPLQFDAAQAGVLAISGASTTPIPVLSEGLLAKIDFRIRGECGQTCRVHALRFYKVRGDLRNSPFNIYNGTFSCPPPGFLGDVNGSNDSIPTPGDALCAHKIALLGALPADETACNNVSAWSASDANCDGQITERDALEIFRHYLQQSEVKCSFLSKAQPVATQPVQLRLSTRTEAGEKVFKAALIAQGNAPVSAFGLDLHFPGNELEFVEVSRTAATAEWIALEGVALSPGVISVGGFHIQELRPSPQAVLCEIIFKLKHNEAVAPVLKIDHLTDDLADAEILIEQEQASNMTPAPKEYGLGQNYPNPFNPSTTIAFDLPQAGPVTLAIYNLLGEKIRTLVNSSLAVGKHQAVWDGQNENGETLPSGIYYYKIEAQDFRAVKKLVMAR